MVGGGVARVYAEEVGDVLVFAVGEQDAFFQNGKNAQVVEASGKFTEVGGIFWGEGPGWGVGGAEFEGGVGVAKLVRD